jgi:hypothetical protein
MTQSFPIGPDSVFRSRNPGFLRLSKRNELGGQCMTYDVAVFPIDGSVVYRFLTVVPHSIARLPGLLVGADRRLAATKRSGWSKPKLRKELITEAAVMRRR